MELNDYWRGYLRERGVSDDVAVERGYMVATSPEGLPDANWSDAQKQQLRFKSYRDGALVIPIFGVGDNETPALHQLRLSVPRTNDKTKKEIKFEVPAGVERGTGPGLLPADVHPSVWPLTWAVDVWEAMENTAEGDVWAGRDVFDDDSATAWAEGLDWSEEATSLYDTLHKVATVIITEGIVKGDAIVSAARAEGLNRIVPVSLTGVDMAVDRGRLVESLQWLDADRFDVVIAFDADWAGNSNVARSIGTLRDALVAEGHTPTMIDLTPHQQHPTDGIDDVLAHGAKLAALLDSARQVHDFVPFPGRMLGEDASEAQMPLDGSQEAVAARLANRALSDDPNLAARFDETRNNWVRFDGCRWTIDGGEQHVREQARDIGETMAATLLTTSEKDPNAVIRSIRSDGHRKGALNLTKDYRDINVTSAQWDREPHLLNTPTGIVDLTDGSIRPASPADQVTMVTRTGYHADAVSPVWDGFLDRTFGGDAELVKFVQIMMGASLTGYPVERLFWLMGNGSDGKSTLVNGVAHVAGDYGVVLDPEKILSRDANTAEYSRAELRGRRMARMPEANADIDAMMMKRVASNDPITGRHPYGRAFSFEPTHTIIVTSNRRPGFSRMDADRGTFRRLTVVPFDNPIPDDQDDKTFGTKLKEAESAEAILAWAVEGAIEFLAAGRNFPSCAAVEEATSSVIDDADVFGEWLQQMIVADEGGRIDQKVLGEHYARWLVSQGRSGRETNNEVGRRIEARLQGAKVGRSNGHRIVRGIAWTRRGEIAALNQFGKFANIGSVADTGTTGRSVVSPIRPKQASSPELYLDDDF